MRHSIMKVAICLLSVFIISVIAAEEVAPASDAITASSATTATAACDLKPVEAAVAELQSVVVAQSATFVSKNDEVTKLLAAQATAIAAIEKTVSAAPSPAQSTPSTAATVDLAPVLAAVADVKTLITEDEAEESADSSVLKDVAATVAKTDAAITKLAGNDASARIEALEKELKAVKALIQQLVDANSATTKKPESSAAQKEVLDKILGLVEKAAAPSEFSTQLSNITAQVGKFLRVAFDTAVAKGSVFAVAAGDWIKQIIANPPTVDVKEVQMTFNKIKNDLAAVLASKGVPKDKVELVSLIVLGVCGVLGVLIALSIIIKFIKCICCCGRKKTRKALKQEGSESKEEAVPSSATGKRGKKNN